MVDGGCRLCILEPSSRGIGWPGMNPDPKRRRVDALCQIAVGTDCSGLETPMMALRQVLDEDLVDISHVFASEIFEPARQQLQVNSRPGILYGDVTTRNHALAPPCGPWCPSEQTTGVHRGQVAFTHLLRPSFSLA